MSYDWYLYSPQATAVEKSLLKSELSARGWHIAFVGEDDLLDENGPLEEALVVAACDKQHADAAEFARLVEQNKFSALMEFAANSAGVLGCEILLRLNYNFAADFDEEEIAEITESSGAEYVQARLCAQSHYLVRTASDELSLDFGDSMAHALAILVGGLLEDPQEDTHEIIDAV